jgi:hypothetical protein
MPRSNGEGVMGKSRPGPHANRTKTHCLRGHPLSGDNLYRRKDGRDCKACRKLWKDENRHTIYACAKRKRAEGEFNMGYLPSVVKRTDPGLLRHAIEMVAQTGRQSAAHEVIGYRRWRAIMMYEPRLAQRVKKLIVRQPQHVVAVAPSIIRATDDIMVLIEARAASPA